MKKSIPTTLAAIVLTATTALAGLTKPVCGDVNDSNSISTTDALLVLKKSVAQPITLSCSGFQDTIDSCTESLAECQGAQNCGNGTLEGAEECETGDLGGATCESEGFGGGTLACASGCVLDTNGCYESRYDASGETIVDLATGLKWEKKQDADGMPNWDNIHDADTSFAWCAPGATYPTCANPGNPFDGTAATVFLAALNGGTGAPCHAGHCDWRLPTIEELNEIFPPGPCEAAPCVADPAFLPATSNAQWSSTGAGASSPHYAWAIIPDTLTPGKYYKRQELTVRAVR
ncbi:MAG: DUF1566 domain-containing protein [Candidatus Binatia bacterium]